MPTMTRQRGFSLIELMVGMLVSMICMLAMMAAFAVFEGKKRTTTSGNDAQQNGSYALYALERQLRTAGASIVQGFNHGLWGCPVTAYTHGKQVLPGGALPAPFTTSTWPRTRRLVPVLIASGGKTEADVIGVVGGNSALQVFNVAVSSTPSDNSVVVANAMGILSGDYLVGTLSNGTCAIARVKPGNTSAATQVADTSLLLDTANSPATGLRSATGVFDIGQTPALTLYGVDANSHALVAWDLLQRRVNDQAAALTPLAEGIVVIKALYGVTDNAGNLDWKQPTGKWAIGQLTNGSAAAVTAIGQIKAIRLAIVAQSRLPERASDYHGDPHLTLFKDLPGDVRYTLNIDPQFRYQVYETTIPVRNAMVSQFY